MSINTKLKSILLVDDESDIVNLFKELLEKGNYEVIVFTNPVEALKHYKTNWNRYGLVISDIRMPEMTGFDLLKNIKKIDATISFFLMSAYDVIEFSELEGIKIDGFIQKPIRIKKLLSTLEKHLINIPISSRYSREN
ncbi:MAG TPA: response regulator [Nitrososphaeraceae archaeon]|nr:response regulator [Nitrososphaeraceae archaeon]